MESRWNCDGNDDQKRNGKGKWLCLCLQLIKWLEWNFVRVTEPQLLPRGTPCHNNQNNLLQQIQIRMQILMLIQIQIQTQTDANADKNVGANTDANRDTNTDDIWLVSP